MKPQVIIILVINLLILIRFINLGGIPIFGDEALYLWLADLVQKDPSTFLKSISYGVFPLNIWLFAILGFINGHLFNPLILGRLVETIFDVGTSGVIFLIGKKLFGKETGVLAMIIYLILPLSFFHSRFALLDPLTNFFATVAIYYSIILTNLKTTREFFLTSIRLGFFLILAFLTKPLAVVAFGATITTPILTIFNKGKFDLKNIYKPIFGLILAYSLLLVSLAVLYFPISPQFTDRYVFSPDTFLSLVSQTKINLWLIYWWSNVYLSWPIILIILFSPLLILLNRSIKLFWVYLWLVSLIFTEALFSARLFPRHLLMMAPPITLIVSYFFIKLFGKNIILLSIVFLLIFLPNINLNSQLIINPSRAAIALEDKQQFYEDWTSGEGLKEITDEIRGMSKRDFIVFIENDPSWIWTLSNVYGFGEKSVKGLDQNELALDQQKDIFIILNKNFTAPSAWPVKLLLAHPKGHSRTINLYQVIQP